MQKHLKELKLFLVFNDAFWKDAEEILAVTNPLAKVLMYLISKPFHCFQCSLFTSSISKSNEFFIFKFYFDH